MLVRVKKTFQGLDGVNRVIVNASPSDQDLSERLVKQGEEIGCIIRKDVTISDDGNFIEGVGEIIDSDPLLDDLAALEVGTATEANAPKKRGRPPKATQ